MPKRSTGHNSRHGDSHGERKDTQQIQRETGYLSSRGALLDTLIPSVLLTAGLKLSNRTSPMIYFSCMLNLVLKFSVLEDLENTVCVVFLIYKSKSVFKSVNIRYCDGYNIE